MLLSAVGLLEGCRPASEPSASSNVDEVVSFEPIFSFDGCSNLRYGALWLAPLHALWQ